MSKRGQKRHEKSRKKDIQLKKIVLITALVQLINAIIELIEKLIE